MKTNLQVNKNLALMQKLRDIINKYDPAGLIVDGVTPEDEYDSEIKNILDNFDSSIDKKQFASYIHSIFKQMFNEDIAGPVDKYYNMASEIHDLFVKKK